MQKPSSAPDLPALQPSWELSLRANRKSPSTIENYTIGLRLYLRWCDANGHEPAIERKLVQAFVVDLLDEGVAPATARARLAALKRLSAWLVEEEELEFDPLLGMKPPKNDSKVIERLSDDELRALVAACKGKAFIDFRDEAIVRLFLEAGLRAGELLRLTVDDVHLGRGLAVVQRGKGGRGRVVSFGPPAGTAIDRYLRRARPHHRLASESKALWLGGGGQTLGYHGLDKALKERAEQAGIKGFHIHLLRHTWASRWRAKGGTSEGLMALAGWSSREMIDRYTASVASDLAAEEAKRLNLGDL
jgi:site-specific recombinase XerD